MTWEEYYDKFYDWAESTQIKKLSSVDKLGPADEVTEVMVEFTMAHEDVVNRIARKAIEQNLIFSAENISDLTNCMDPDLQGKLALQSVKSFSKEDLNSLGGFLDDDIMAELYRKRGWTVPDILADYDEMDTSNEEDGYDAEPPKGFFSKLALAFGMGYGIKKGIESVQESRQQKYFVGDHVRVKYRGQEGTIIDINGDLYMVSMDDGKYVDSFLESQIERAW